MAKSRMAISTPIPTLADVALRACVHKVTASVVLSGAKAKTRVSEETRQRVIQAAEDLKYQPNVQWRSLQTQRCDIVGFFPDYPIVDLENPFVYRLVTGLQAACFDQGLDLLMHSYRSGSELDAALVRKTFLGRKTDGLVIHSPVETPLVRYLADTYLPVVAVVDACSKFPSVVADEAMGGRLIAEHLHERGIKRAFYLAKPFEIDATTRRREGFLALASEHGIQVIVGTNSEDAGEYLRDTANLPCAVCAWSDSVVVPVVSLCAQLGLRIPQDVSLIGYDGISPLPNYPGSLTTVVAPWAETARTALALLMKLRNGESVPTSTVLPVTLRVGDSCI